MVEGRWWRHTVRCAHVNEKHVPRERRQLRVGMGAVHRSQSSVKEWPGAGAAGYSDRHRAAAGSASPFLARHIAVSVPIWG